MNPDDQSNAFQQPDFVVGYTVGADRGYETFPLEIAQGRATAAGDEGQRVVFMGSDLAREFDKGPECSSNSGPPTTLLVRATEASGQGHRGFPRDSCGTPLMHNASNWLLSPRSPYGFERPPPW